MYDQNEIQRELGQRVDAMLRESFGRLVGPPDGHASRIYLPGGAYCAVVTTSADDAITVHKRVAAVENVQGLGEALMREHSTRLFGRYELGPDGALAVEYSMPAAGLSVELLYNLVLCVHGMAVDAEKLLAQAGVLVASDVGDAET